MRMSPKPGSPCSLLPDPLAAPLSLTTAKLMLACCAHTCAALSTWLFQLAAPDWLRYGLALKEALRLLVAVPPRLVPSGMKLIVMRLACGQALPVTEYKTVRSSSRSTAGRVSRLRGRADDVGRRPGDPASRRRASSQRMGASSRVRERKRGSPRPSGGGAAPVASSVREPGDPPRGGAGWTHGFASPPRDGFALSWMGRVWRARVG